MTKAEIRSKLDEIVDFAGVERYIDTPVKRYSSGMKVRLGFAVAAHLEPEILVVDEVLAVGDAEFQKKAIGKMQEVSHKDGRTVLFVSHNMASIKNLCTRAVMLKNGSTYKEGNVNEIITTYLTDNIIKSKKIYELKEIPKNKVVWIQRAFIERNGKVTDNVLCGDKITISIDYKSLETGHKAEMYIGIYNAYNEKLLHLGTQFDKKESFITQKEGTIKCTIPKLPLTPGKYIINLSLHIDGQPHDRIINSFQFMVENGDFYGNGKLPEVKENKFLIEQNWIIE
jgi:lipopolysaccharide transport system ATP-binding protein